MFGRRIDVGLRGAPSLYGTRLLLFTVGPRTYLHTDYVAGRMPSTVKTLALADAMFSVDHNSFDGQPLYPERMQWGYSAWNSSASVNQECLAAVAGTNRSDGWKCMFGSTAAQYVKTPLFVLNSKSPRIRTYSSCSKNFWRHSCTLTTNYCR